MGFFKEFKDDFSDAVNELVPDANYDDADENLETSDEMVDTLDEEIDVDNEKNQYNKIKKNGEIL